MAYLLSTTINGNLTVNVATTTANLFVGSVEIKNTMANTVDVYANSGSLQAASRLNFNNTGSVTVTVSAGSAGNANISFSASGGGGASVITVTPSTNQDNYNPAGLSGATEMRVNATATLKFTGLTAQPDGTEITIMNMSTDYLLWLENENTASTAANRFTLPNAFPAFLMPEDAIKLAYNALISRWVVVEWGMKGSAMGLQFFTDFLEGTTGATTSTVSGTGASSQVSTFLVNATEKPVGVTQIDTGTTTTGRATLGNAGTAQIVPTTGAALHVARVVPETAPSAAETFQLFTGFIDSSGGTATDGVTWNLRWTGSVSEWSQDRFAGGTATRTNTGSPAVSITAYVWLGIFINPTWTRADFFYSTDSVSFTVASSPTTGFPNNTQYTAWAALSMIKSAGTTQRNSNVDLAGFRFDGVRG